MGQPVNVQAQNVMLTNSNGVSYRPKAGMMAGWTGAIAPEWRSLLGGDSYTGQCCIAIIGRSSYGPSVSAFNSSDTGAATVPATMLLGFPDEFQNLGPWGGPISPYYSGADTMGSTFPVYGTRSWLSVGRHGTGQPEMGGQNCYGPGTANAALIGQPDGQGNRYCYDPSNSNKGPHSWRYIFQIMAWDANDFAAVKAGAKKPWDVRPYAAWNAGVGSPLDIPGVVVTGAAFDQQTRRLYVSTGWTDVYVFEVDGSGPPPPTDRDCVETPGEWSGWTPNADGKTESNRRTWTQTVSKLGNGASCFWTKDASPAVETITRDIVTIDECAANPVVVTQVAWPGSTEGRRSGSLVWSVANVVSTLKSILWSYGPQSVTVTDSRGCPATVKR
jgi:hypothetical protein